MKLDRWKKLISSDNPANRSHAADILPDGKKFGEVTTLLIKALHDEDALVRTCAADTLGLINSNRVRIALRTAYARETDDLVRNYIADSLGFVGTLSDLRMLVDEALSLKGSRTASLGRADAIAALALNHSATEIIRACRVRSWKRRAGGFARLKYLVALLIDKIDLAVKVAKARKGREGGALERDHISNILLMVKQIEGKQARQVKRSTAPKPRGNKPLAAR